MRRRHFLLAILVVATSLVANLTLDYLLILRNPAELELMVAEALGALAAAFTPQLGALESFSLRERRLVFRDLVLHERDRPTESLLSVERVEARLSQVPPEVYVTVSQTSSRLL